jgi:hypothetical protein
VASAAATTSAAAATTASAPATTTTTTSSSTAATSAAATSAAATSAAPGEREVQVLVRVAPGIQEAAAPDVVERRGQGLSFSLERHELELNRVNVADGAGDLCPLEDGPELLARDGGEDPDDHDDAQQLDEREAATAESAFPRAQSGCRSGDRSTRR